MSTQELGNGIKASIERHKLSDGSMVDDVMIRWPGGMMKISAESEPQARRIIQELVDVPHVEITTWDSNERTQAFLKKIASLTPATKDHEPGIGAGMLNQLIDEAKALLAG